MEIGIGHGVNPGTVWRLICPHLPHDEREPKGILIAIASPHSVDRDDVVKGKNA
jgi:hypothetical protein